MPAFSREPRVPEENQAGDPPFISLDRFLKLAGVVGTGGQAKILIQTGLVQVNGELETRRRRKLYPGDLVEFDGESLEVGWEDD